MSNGNRLRNDLANLPRQMVKKSGDVHLAPFDDGPDAPQRPHRASREDMQKTGPAQTVPPQEGPRET